MSYRRQVVVGLHFEMCSYYRRQRIVSMRGIVAERPVDLRIENRRAHRTLLTRMLAFALSVDVQVVQTRRRRRMIR